jgi:hypothetical protein
MACEGYEMQIRELTDRLHAAEERVKALESDMRHLLEYWNGNVNERAMSDALYHMEEVLSKALAAAKEPAPCGGTRVKP